MDTIKYSLLSTDDTIKPLNSNVIKIGVTKAEWFAPAPIDAWWRSCTISYSFGTFAEMLDVFLAYQVSRWPIITCCGQSLSLKSS